MGLFDKKKIIDTTRKYTNNITERLTSMLIPRFAREQIFLQESGDAKYLNIMAASVSEAMGTITRDNKNVATHIAIYTKGVPPMFQPAAQDALNVYIGRDISNVPNPY